MVIVDTISEQVIWEIFGVNAIFTDFILVILVVLNFGADIGQEIKSLINRRKNNEQIFE